MNWVIRYAPDVIFIVFLAAVWWACVTQKNGNDA